MAKRVPKDEEKFNPLDESLVRAVVNRTARSGPAAVAEVPTPPDTFDKQSSDDAGMSMGGQQGGRGATPQESHKPLVSREPSLTRRDREKRVLLTRDEERDVERFVTRFAAELGTPVKLSHLLRASLTLLLHGEEELIERAKRATLERPGNGNAPELARFEQGVTEILSLAYREARPLRSR